MTNKRIYTSGSRNMVYHFPGCRYTEMMVTPHTQRKTRATLDWLGYRPCRRCNTMAFHFRQEQGSLAPFLENKTMEIKLEGHEVTVRTEAGRWRIAYDDNAQAFILWHGNRAGEGWHRQMDKPVAKSITEYVKYIHRHDLYRQAEAEGRDIKVDRKYEHSVRKARMRRETRRLDSLFAQLEAENRGYRELSYC